MGTAWGQGVHKDGDVQPVPPSSALVTPSLAIGDPVFLSGLLPTFLKHFPPRLLGFKCCACS